MVSAAQSASAAKAGRGPSGSAPDTGADLTRAEEDELKVLRYKCSDSLWVGCAILSRGGLQELAR
eukprot:10079074-Lingulodinium_polyedra.AAC.1